MTAALAAETATMSITEPDEFGHKWVGAATVCLTLKEAKRADLRGSIRVPAQTRIDVLDTYCSACRKPFEDVAGVRCAHLEDPEMFHGGPIGVRAKRTGHGAPGHSCADLGCNTGAGLLARRQAAVRQEEADRRNGRLPDTIRSRPVPVTVSVPGVGVPQQRHVPQVAPVIVLDPEAEARHAARVLAARRGKRRPVNPFALTLW